MDAFFPLISFIKMNKTVSFFSLYQKYKQTDFAKCVYKVDLKKNKNTSCRSPYGYYSFFTKLSLSAFLFVYLYFIFDI